MKCEDYQNLIIEELYDEITPGDRKKLKSHLRVCPDCTARLEALRSTSQTLKKWPDVDPKLNLTFIPEKRLSANGWLKRFGFKQFAYGFAGACAAVLLILAIGNTRISYQNGDFEFQASLRPVQTALPSENYLTKADLEQFKQENYTTIGQIITENNERERIRQALVLSDLYNEMETKRQTDLVAVSQTLQQVNYGNEERFDQTNQALSALIQYVNYQFTAKP